MSEKHQFSSANKWKRCKYCDWLVHEDSMFEHLSRFCKGRIGLRYNVT